MTRSVVRASFTITRVWNATPQRVFRAFADEKTKAQWFGGPASWVALEKRFDFREGGREIMAGRADNGTVHRFDCLYRDIVPPDDGHGRIIYSYVMHLDARKISVSQATIEIRPEGAGTRLVVTEYGDFLDGYDDAGSREEGTNWLMDKLGASLED